MQAQQSLDQCCLQVSQEAWKVPAVVPVPHAGAERLPVDSSQQQAVEVLPVQEQLHVLEEEALTEPAELGCSVQLKNK